MSARSVCLGDLSATTQTEEYPRIQEGHEILRIFLLLSLV